MTAIRVLNEEGVLRFKEYIVAAKADPALSPPRELLDDGRFSDPFRPLLEVDAGSFDQIYDLGCYLQEVLKDCDPRTISRNHGLWSWLALFFIDVLAPPSDSGERKVLSESVYVLEGQYSFRRYYRHIIRTAWLAVREHGEKARVLLITSGGGARSEIAEQIAAYPDLFGCPNIVSAAYELYFDKTAGKPKRGSGGKGAGSPRRLAAVVRQLQLTYDLNDCPIDVLLGLLPREFNRWKPGPAA